MLSGRKKKDYAAESAAEALATQAAQLGVEPHELAADDDDDELDDEDLELEPERSSPPRQPDVSPSGRGSPPRPLSTRRGVTPVSARGLPHGAPIPAVELRAWRSRGRTVSRPRSRRRIEDGVDSLASSDRWSTG